VLCVVQSESPRKVCGEINSVKNTALHIWLNDGVY